MKLKQVQKEKWFPDTVPDASLKDLSFITRYLRCVQRLHLAIPSWTDSKEKWSYKHHFHNTSTVIFKTKNTHAFYFILIIQMHLPNDATLAQFLWHINILTRKMCILMGCILCIPLKVTMTLWDSKALKMQSNVCSLSTSAQYWNRSNNPKEGLFKTHEKRSIKVNYHGAQAKKENKSELRSILFIWGLP